MNSSYSAEWVGRKIFITGAFGFLGTWLSQALLRNGCEIVGYSRSVHSGFSRLVPASEIAQVCGSVHDFPRLAAEVVRSRADTVFHVAADNDNSATVKAPICLFETNIQGTWNLLEACRRLESLDSVVICSSGEAIGIETSSNDPSDVKVQSPRRPYAVSKYAAELIAQTYADTYSLPVTIGRIENIYGGGDYNWQRLIPGSINALLQNKVPMLHGDIELGRDYLYVEDAVDALMSLSVYGRDPTARGRVFHFASGILATAADVLEQLCIIAGVTNVAIEHKTISLRQREHVVHDYQGIREKTVLGWTAKTALRDGLRRTFDWYEQNMFL